MGNKYLKSCLGFIWLVGILVVATPGLQGQLDVRVNDPMGRSIRLPRVQVIHSDRPELAGTSMHLQQTNPWLAYEMGSNSFQREWRTRDGVFLSLVQRPTAGAANSCAMCHNLPFGTAGAGGNAPEPKGFGRNIPHLFGIGLVETLGIQIRAQIMAKYDLNKNGFLEAPAEIRGKKAILQASPGVNVDYGYLDDLDGDGFPELNDLIKVTVVDANGIPRPLRLDRSSPRLGDPGVAGYDIAVGILSSSVGDHQLSTIRTFAIGVMQSVMGLQITDNTVTNDTGSGRDQRALDGWAEVSNAGSPQLHFPIADRKLGNKFQYVSEGELDLMEWYLLNSPTPAVAAQTNETKRGRKLLSSLGCLACHLSNWQILSANEAPGLPGDRRFFDLTVNYNAASKRLEGKVRSLTRATKSANVPVFVPRREGFTVNSIFSDFLHHDVGERFYEYTYQDGRLLVTKRFRTPPLWGVGMTPPYGHDGRSQSLDEVIRRHGGEAVQSQQAYEAASSQDRDALLSFLKTLILFQPELLPTDIDADGTISKTFRVGGAELGVERLVPEFLFQVAPRYRGWIEYRGERYFSYELLNAGETYGRDLEFLIDSDGNGIPDASPPIVKPAARWRPGFSSTIGPVQKPNPKEKDR